MVVIQAQNLTDLSDGSHYAGKSYVVTETWTPIYDSKSKAVHSGTLDENGHASFEIKMKKNRKYILAISQPDNICYSDLSFHHLNHESTNNVNCNGPEDSVTYTRTWLTGESVDGTNTYSGCDYYSGNYFERPVGEYRYDWEVTKNGVTTSHSQTFILTENDSTVFEITY